MPVCQRAFNRIKADCEYPFDNTLQVCFAYTESDDLSAFLFLLQAAEQGRSAVPGEAAEEGICLRYAELARIFSDSRSGKKVSCRYGKQNRKETSESRSGGVSERLFCVLHKAGNPGNQDPISRSRG